MRQGGFDLSADDCTALLVEQIPVREILFRGETTLTNENLTLLAHQMEQALHAADWPEASRWAAHLLLIEHGVNVLKHGRAVPGSAFSVQVRQIPEAIEILVRDGGQAWKYEEAPEVKPDDQADHGRGLLMIRGIASYVASHHDGSENLTLFGILRSWQAPT